MTNGAKIAISKIINELRKRNYLESEIIDALLSQANRLQHELNSLYTEGKNDT